MKFCNCDDWKTLESNKSTLFVLDPVYGWVLHWKELSKEKGYVKVHKYGIPIAYCPMCGRQLKGGEDE